MNGLAAPGCPALLLCLRHRSTSILDSLAKLPGRVAEDVVAVAIEYGYLVPMPEQPLSSLMVKDDHEVCPTEIIRDNEFRAPLIQGFDNFRCLGASPTGERT